jgi:hypothetical protein
MEEAHATVSLFVNDQKVGEAKAIQTHAFALGVDGTMDVGPPFPFTATIASVTIQPTPPSN